MPPPSPSTPELPAMVESVTVNVLPELLRIPPPAAAELSAMVEPVTVRVPSL